MWLSRSKRRSLRRSWVQFRLYEFSQGPLGFKNRHTGLTGDPIPPLDVGWCGDSGDLTFPPLSRYHWPCYWNDYSHLETPKCSNSGWFRRLIVIMLLNISLSLRFLHIFQVLTEIVPPPQNFQPVQRGKENQVSIIPGKHHLVKGLQKSVATKGRPDVLAPGKSTVKTTIVLRISSSKAKRRHQTVHLLLILTAQMSFIICASSTSSLNKAAISSHLLWVSLWMWSDSTPELTVSVLLMEIHAEISLLHDLLSHQDGCGCTLVKGDI